MSTKDKRAFITGIFGQDGSYLAEHLLSLGYEILGLESSLRNDASHIRALRDHSHVEVIQGDFGEKETYREALRHFVPSEVYNFAAVSDLGAAVKDPERTMRINYGAFDALARTSILSNPHVRIFQALSSRILVPDQNGIISETSPLSDSDNPYDVAKRKSFEETVLPLRREGHFVASGFLCNHESPRRGTRFVTGKIVDALARIARGEETVLEVGNLESQRDWSFAGDFVRGMHAALQAETPDDYVFGSGELHTVREFIEEATKTLTIPLTWKGEGVSAVGMSGDRIIVRSNEAFYRPHDVSPKAEITKLREKIGYTPHVSFTELVRLMAKDAYENATPSVV
jgi:GDPmannose 4,6-dehydratase